MTVLTRGAYAEAGTALDFKTGSWRIQKPVYQHQPAPCHTACPAGEDAQAYIAHIQSGQWVKAWQTLVAVNPMPAITGRVCPHFCESACNRQHFDDPISIHAIERFLGDEAIRQDWVYPVTAPQANAPTIAVVGAGPAGLAAAYHLLRLGYRATVFDDHSEAGGTLRTALPPYRLPRAVLDAELNRLLALSGIEFHPHTRLGRDVSLKELQQDYARVFLGVGAQQAQEWHVDGATPSDLHSGLDLLRKWMNFGSVPTPKSVAIVGAGNTAVDIARIMKRAGVADVHIISHKPIPKAGIPASEAMPAIAREVYEALEEGVIIHEYRGIQRLILRGEKIVGIEMVHMKKLKQPNGRLRRVAFTGTETILPVEQVIPAIGQVMDKQGMEKLFGNGNTHFEINHWGLINGQETLFSGGDARWGSGTVTEAIGDGRRAALGIHAQLQQQPFSEKTQATALDFKQLNLHYYAPATQVKEPILPIAERDDQAEIVQDLSAHAIQQEAERCFSCGNCLACDNCWTLCPDSAVLKTTAQSSTGADYVFDYDYCKGCGLCANECPCGYIQMEAES